MNTTRNRAARRGGLIGGTGFAMLLVILAAGGEGDAWAKCKVGTQTQPVCTLSLPSPSNAQLTLPEEYTGTRGVTSPASYTGIPACPQRFVVEVNGEGKWSRLTIRPTRRPDPRPGALSDTVAAASRECDCVNMEAEVVVRSWSKISHCEGGCIGCSLAEYCANPGQCDCSWTPIPLNHFPHATKKATGIWVPQHPHAGPAHCELKLEVYRNSSSPSWAGAGGTVAAVVYDKRTGDTLPLSVAARYLVSDPAVLTGGCPNCPD